MKTLSTVPLALSLLVATGVWGQDLSGRYLYQSPQGPVALVLQHNGTQVVGTMTGVDGQASRLQGTYDGQKAIGTISMAGTTGWFAVGFLGEGLTLLVAEIDPSTGQPNLDDGWRLDFARSGPAPAGAATGPAAGVPGGAQPGPARAEAAASSSPLVQQWLQHLRGKSISFRESYTSNDARGFGGYSIGWDAYLCSDMRFFYRSRSRVSADVGGVSGQGRSGDSFDGTWRIIEHSGQAILQYQPSEVAGTDQGYSVVLSIRDGRTFFDNNRVLVTNNNDMCP
jgi:hypothetical protein